MSDAIPQPPAGFQMIGPAPVATPAPPPGFVLHDAKANFGIDLKQPNDVVRAQIAKLPDAQKPAAIKAWAEAVVAREHEDSPTLMAASDKMRQVARGTPIGSWLDEGSAFLNEKLFGVPYDEGVAYQRERDRYADANSTVLAKLPVVGDVTTGGLAKLSGAVASLPLAPMPGVGRSMLGTMGKTAAAGAGYGAAYGAGEGETPSERVQNAFGGALVAGGVGAAAPPLARAAGNVVGAAANMVRKLPPELAGLSPKAVRNVLSDVEADQLFMPGRQNVGSQAGALGNQAMLADMGRNLAEHAGGLATKPGISSEISAPLLARSEGASARLQAATDRAMGPPVSVPREVERLRAAAAQRAGPLYRKFYETPVKPSEDLYGILDRANAVGALDRARRKMAADGFDPYDVFYKGYPNAGVANAALNPRFLDYTKRSIDDMAGVAKRAGERDDARIFTKLAGDLRSEVDRILAPHAPETSIWARARKIAGDDARLEDAFEAGQKAFAKSLSYEQMLYDMRKMTPAERAMYRTGARSQIAEIADNAGTMFGSSGDTAVMRTLGTTAADKKLRQIATTPQAGAALSRVRDAEAVFAGTEKNLLQNSKTAVRTEQAKRYPLDANDASLHNITLEGMVFGPAKAAVNILMNGALTASRVRAATDAARMLTAQGVRRDEIIRGLRAFQAQQAVTGTQRRAAGQVINGLLTGGRVNLIDANAARDQAMSP